MVVKMQNRTSLVIGFVVTLLFSTQAMSAPSAADCAAEADRAVRGSTTAMGSAGRGALRGAAFGAIVGDSSKSAGRGAALGGMMSGARQRRSNNDTYNRVYDSCMARV